MNDYIGNEFQRILTNPDNEIISDSLKERLRPTSEPIVITLLFGDDTFECALDSFSEDIKTNRLKKISMLLSSDAALRLLAGSQFCVRCANANLEIESSETHSINCFRYEGDTYVLELKMSNKEALND
jgi:hypothetical protein